MSSVEIVDRLCERGAYERVVRERVVCDCERVSTEGWPEVHNKKQEPHTKMWGMVHQKQYMSLSCESILFQELAELVPRFMQSPASKAPEDAARLRDLRLKAATVLGKGHWTYFLATFAWLQKCLRRSTTFF